MPLSGSSAPAIQAIGLARRFGDRLAVEGLDLRVEQGEVFGFLGPNGSGKTTTLRMLSTLISPSAGEAFVLGHDVVADAAHIRPILGVMTERPGLYERLTIDDNLRFWAEAHQVANIERAIGEALDFVDLAARRHERVGGLSKGMKQRVALARAVLHRPRVLLLDEPSSGLDPAAAVQMEEMIRQLVRGGATVFLNTHRLAEAQRLCDRVAILRTRLIAVGSPAELRARYFGERLSIRLARPPTPLALAAIRSVPGVRSLTPSGPALDVTVDDFDAVTPGLVAAAVRAGAAILEVSRDGDLEQVYLDLVSGSSPEPLEVAA